MQHVAFLHVFVFKQKNKSSVLSHSHLFQFLLSCPFLVFTEGGNKESEQA